MKLEFLSRLKPNQHQPWSNTIDIGAIRDNGFINLEQSLLHTISVGNSYDQSKQAMNTREVWKTYQSQRTSKSMGRCARYLRRLVSSSNCRSIVIEERNWGKNVGNTDQTDGTKHGSRATFVGNSVVPAIVSQQVKSKENSPPYISSHKKRRLQVPGCKKKLDHEEPRQEHPNRSKKRPQIGSFPITTARPH
ncbi:unnamed protein product [Dovyalis caffra]|uniref:Uncharacterized protein n=1 Tax=Dovyalis caffra TaxID=77055 RepID=A0AAV1QXH0_9ROSI|nr:unnamed protein product [Dovyalis caffra]